MTRSAIMGLAGVFLILLAGVVTAADTGVEVIRDQVYIERETGPLALDVYIPQGEGPFPGLLVVHGGAWTIGSRAQLAAVAMAFAERGYTAAAISYRLAPKHPFPAQIYDCQAAVRWLRQNADRFKIDPMRIGGYGYSAGGQLVALLGTLGDDDFREPDVSAEAPSTRLQAVIAGGAPCDFRIMPANSRRLTYWLGGTRAAKPEAYRTASPATFITPDDPPMFFFHGAQDALVPIASPQRMVELLISAGITAEIHTVENKGHIEALFDGQALQQALAFADRHLKGDDLGGEDAPARLVEHPISNIPPPASGASDGQ